MAGQVSISIGYKQWSASLAVAPWELTQGLGGIAGLPAGTGMLFDLGCEQTIEVTTAPMLFPLDIAFFSDDLAVTEVYHDVEPGLLLTSASPARYFLEANAGELEGVELGESATVIMLLEDVPAAPSWTTALYGLAGMLVILALLSVLVKNTTADALPEPETPRLLPQTRSSKKQTKPVRDAVSVHSWTERDRLGIWITDSRTDKSLAEWWDEEARQMFEDGFFKPGTVHNQEITGQAFEKSVLGYAEHIGILALTALPSVQPKATGEDPVAALFEKWSRAKRNSALALKDLEALGPRYDIEECKEALLEYRDLERSDYDDAEEYQEARDEAWEAFLECLDSLSEEEEEDEEDEEQEDGEQNSDKPPGEAKGLPFPPGRHAATRLQQQKQITDRPDSGGKKPRLDYLPDSPELLARTIEDIGYRDRIDSAFTQAISRARGER